MASAREQARKAVDAAIDTPDLQPSDGSRLADAASDVWEPLVRDLFEAFFCLVIDVGIPAHLRGIGTRVKEALGDS